MLKARIDSALRTARRGLLVLAVAATALSVDASAQCAKPDGLDGGPCCALAQPSWPTIPKFKQDTLGICWRDCNIESTANYRAVWTPWLSGAPGIICKPPLKRLRLIDTTTGSIIYSGVMREQYSRTWTETDNTGLEYQVWRYLVNGDLQPSAAAVLPCPVPPCAPLFNNRVRFTGYVDMARDCSTAGNTLSEFAWMLTHACDSLEHAPGFPRAGGGHPDRSYTFVGPRAGFVPGPLQPVEAGGGPFEAVRRIAKIPGAGHQCQFEEPIDFQLNPVQDMCLCGQAAAPQQFTLSNLDLNGACGTAVFTTGGPFLPGFISMGLGTWTNPAVFPGPEILRWNAGGYDYFEPCVGTVRQEVFFGVSTIGGWPARQVVGGAIGLPLPLIFVDQANSLRSVNTIMNLPFQSDHILNLNM